MMNKKVLLFDLGGVVIHLNDPASIFGLHCSVNEFLHQWLHSTAVRRHEQGAIDAQQFAAEIIREIDLPYDEEEFLKRFANWPGDLFPGILELLDNLRGRHTIAVLSNTNAFHWEGSPFATMLEPRFESVFLSYQTGLLKPDMAAFQQVGEELGCSPQDVVFFDDNSTNIAAAAEFGFESRLTRGLGELLAALDDLNIPR